QQVVRQQVRPDLLLDHRGRLAAQHIHFHGRFDRTDIDLPVPPPLVQVADLPAVYRLVQDRGDDSELFGAVVLVAGVHAHLSHDQALGVGAVLLPLHAVRLVGALPDDDVAVGPAPHRPGPHALVLGAGDQVDAALAQLAGDEVIVEQGVGQDHVAG